MIKYFKNRFFLLYTIATVIMFVIIFIVIFIVYRQMITHYFFESTVNKMVAQGNRIATEYLQSEAISDPNHLNFRKSLEMINEYTDTRTLIISKDYRIVYDSICDCSIDLPLSNSFLKESLEGNVIKETGTFGGFFENSAITVSLPIISNNNVEGVVIMRDGYPEFKKDMEFLYKMTLLGIVVVLLVALLSIYIFSIQMKKILIKFNKASQQIANGDFSSRIKLPNKGDFGELAKNMNNMAEELETLEDMRKNFIANISHDFRSPLTSIQGFVQAILDGTIPYEKQKKYLHIVLDESERLTRLTNDILLLSKFENKALPLEKMNFDIHQLIRKVLIKFEQSIVDKDIHITFLTEQKELNVYADMNQIQRVLHNIIDNAIKFCSSGDSIIVETSTSKSKVNVSIKDTGTGISEKNIKYIWDRFHKGDRSRGVDRKGIGLGLTIVREIIKAHNETINVYSKEGKGTLFVFTLTKSTAR